MMTVESSRMRLVPYKTKPTEIPSPFTIQEKKGGEMINEGNNKETK